MQCSVGLYVVCPVWEWKAPAQRGSHWDSGVLEVHGGSLAGEAANILQGFRAQGTKSEIWVPLLPQSVTLDTLLSHS